MPTKAQEEPIIEKTERNWEPVRSGAQYCAPACGHGCTWREHLAAKRHAAALAKALGPNWYGEVHENLGWHSYAQLKRNSNVSVTGAGRQYICFTGTMITGHGITPREAADDAARQLTAVAHQYVDLASAAEEK